jgi:hypothetical protein
MAGRREGKGESCGEGGGLYEEGFGTAVGREGWYLLLLNCGGPRVEMCAPFIAAKTDTRKPFQSSYPFHITIIPSVPPISAVDTRMSVLLSFPIISTY